jgi:DNA polymerase V
LLVRRINLVAGHVVHEGDVLCEEIPEQMDLFTNYEIKDKEQTERVAILEREKSRQRAILEIKKKYGKNAILKGMNFEEGATGKDRNRQIGGHKA